MVLKYRVVFECAGSKVVLVIIPFGPGTGCVGLQTLFRNRIVSV